MRCIICIPAAAPDTSAVRRHVRVRTYNIYTRAHKQLRMGVPFASTSRARCTTERNANHARGAPSPAARCAIPRCRMLAAAHRSSWVKLYMYVRSQFSFQLSFFPAVIQLTVVANLHRADVFRVRLGGHCREFGVKPCSNGAYFSIRRSQRTV